MAARAIPWCGAAPPDATGRHTEFPLMHARPGPASGNMEIQMKHVTPKIRHMARYVLILTTGIVVGAGITLERAVLAERKDDRKETVQPLPLEDLRTFTEVFGRIKSDYVEPVDDKKLLQDAIQGMLSGLDPHSAYLNPEAYKEIRIGTEGEFGGLGIEVTMEDGFVKVVTPIDDTPAKRAGIEAGDVIIRLDDTPVKGLALGEAVKMMRGQPGSKIVLTIVREGESAPLKITVTRAVIKIESVKSRMLEPGYGYVRVTQFQGNTGDSLVQALNKLKKENKGALKGLVLDLRNNPGGVLNAAVAVSDAFLKKGMIVYTKGRIEDSKLSFTATPPESADGAAMVVLVNGGSASASEIVAGALQDQKRAVIMGTKTFGKGSVQTILPMANGAALKVTTARYYTPSGRSIQATGIVPDIVVEDLKLSKKDSKGLERLREADLARHLENGDAPVEKKSKAPTKDKKEPGKAPAAGEDYQLDAAVNLLKGVNIVRAQSAQ